MLAVLQGVGIDAAAAARGAAFVSTFWTSSLLFPVGPAYGSEVAFRPPSWVFGLAWASISTAAGASWAFEHAHEKNGNNSPPSFLVDLCFVLLLVCLITFSAKAQTDKTGAAWSVAGALAIALALTTSMTSWQAKALLSPLCAWLIFALILQTTLVQTEALAQTAASRLLDSV